MPPFWNLAILSTLDPYFQNPTVSNHARVKWHKWYPKFCTLLRQGFRSPVSSMVENFRGGCSCHLIPTCMLLQNITK